MSCSGKDEIDFVFIPGKTSTGIFPRHIQNSRCKQSEMLVFGRCMWPLLNPGDRLRVEPVASSTVIKKGWVVVFEWDGKVFSHRVIRVEGDQFWAQGDISRATQGPIHRSKLLGRVVAYRRNESWNSLEGEFHRLGGLAYNATMHYVLDGVEQLPFIKRLWKGAWIGDSFTKQIGAVVSTALMGTVVVTQETRLDVIYGILQSDGRLVGDETADAFLLKNPVELFIAHGRWEVQLGCAILYNVGPKQETGLVRLSPVNALVMPLDVEKELYQAIGCAAQRKGIKRLLTSVAKDDVYAQEIAIIAGYHQIAVKTLGARIRKVLPTANLEEVFYEKLL